MLFLLPTILCVLILLGTERLLHRKDRGRKVLATIAFALAMIDAVLSAGLNPNARLITFTITVLDASVAIGSWCGCLTGYGKMPHVVVSVKLP